MLSTLTGFVIVFNIGILLPSISEDLGLSPSQQGLLGSAASWGNVLLTIPLGWWTTRFSPKAVIASTLFMGTLLIFLQGWSPAFAAVLIGRLGFGVALLAMEPPGAALLHQWFPPERIVFVNSISNAIFGITMGLGLVATPLIFEALGGEWRLVFYVSGGIYALLTVIWLIFGREQRRRSEQSKGPEVAEPSPDSTPISAVIRHRDLLLASVGMGGAIITWAAFLSFFPTLMLDRYGVSLTWSGGLLALNLAVGGISGLVMSYFASRTLLLKVTLVLLGFMMSGGYFAMTLTGDLGLLVLFAAGSGLSGAYFPLLYSTAFQLRGVTADRIPVAVAVIMTAISLGMMIGPMMVGYLQEAMGELRTPLFIACAAAFVLVPVGALISFGSPSSSGAAEQSVD